MSRKIYLCLLLTTLIVQQGYKTKTQLQRLSEGNIVPDTPVSKKSNKKKDKSKKNKKSQAPSNTGQQKLEISAKEEQKTPPRILFCLVPYGAKEEKYSPRILFHLAPYNYIASRYN